MLSGKKADFFDQIREIYEFMKSGYIQAYCELYRQREKENKDPLDCVYVKTAMRKILQNGEPEKILPALKNLVAIIENKQWNQAL
jgi:hypothetical protein